jgi:dTDP-4-dehydrorhamnose reductase
LRILLTGRNGQVGWELERVLPALGELIATDRSTMDLADPDGLRRQVRDLNPDVIVNAAAYTAVDKAESEPALAMRINGAAPGALAEEAKRRGALLVHYSTDYVFDGQKEASYVEDDAPNPINVYGRSKLEGERQIAASGCRFLLLRTSWVYAPRGKNFFLTIARKVRAGEDLRVVDDQRGVPTEAKFLAETTAAMLGADTEGLFHLVPRGDTTWHGFATQIAQRLGSGQPIQAIGSSDYPTPARRPTNSVLDNRRLSRQLAHPLPAWPSLLERCMSVWTRA